MKNSMNHILQTISCLTIKNSNANQSCFGSLQNITDIKKNTYYSIVVRVIPIMLHTKTHTNNQPIK